MKRICYVFILCILFLTGVSKAVAESKFISGSFFSDVYIGQENKLYIVKANFQTHNKDIYRISFPDLNVKKCFSIRAEANISMGNNEICFCKVYFQPPFVSHVGPHQYFTAPIEGNGILTWKARTGIQTYFQENGYDCFYSGNKLFLSQVPSGGINTEIPYQSKLYVIEDEGRREVLAVENGVFTCYDSGILIEYAEKLQKRGQYDIFDVKNERIIHIPSTQDEISFVYLYFIIIDQTVYYSSDHRVCRYDVSDQTTEEIVSSQQTRKPLLFYSTNSLFIYSVVDRKVYKYDPSLRQIVAQYDIPENIPYDVYAIYDDMLITSQDRHVFIYYLETDKLTQIDLD